MCETKNNEWKRHKLSILNSIDNCIKINLNQTRTLQSLNKGLNPYKAFIYRLCRDFFQCEWVRFGYKNLIYIFLADPFALNHNFFALNYFNSTQDLIQLIYNSIIDGLVHGTII